MFDLFKLTDEHKSCARCSVTLSREGDRAARRGRRRAASAYPVEAQKALTAAGFQAVHIPEEYDGQGADAVATCIVIEEVARVCASSSLIPAVNKLGSMPLILSGSEELKQQVLPVDRLRRGDDLATRCRSARPARDAAAMRTRARRRR